MQKIIEDRFVVGLSLHSRSRIDVLAEIIASPSDVKPYSDPYYDLGNKKEGFPKADPFPDTVYNETYDKSA